MATVREDVIKLTFDINNKGLIQAEGSVDNLLEAVKQLGGAQGTGKAEDGFDDATRAAKKLGGVDLGKLKGGLDSLATSAAHLTAKLAGTAIKGLTVGITASATAVAALGTAAIKGYAEYEQLVGGVDTLFKDSSKQVQQYANNAYKTAGLSANEYMSTVTSFSASLLQSLGGDTEAAASMADQAIRDMADNANKMGTDMTAIQDAYMGFAKQNFTMLDNLKLGYGGTKTEMERLLADATAISGIKYDISSYADIVSAIHVIQEEMGIAGTTAAEAEKTIQGSFLAMKSSWSNFVTGLANEDADFDVLLDNLVGSVETFADNLIPRIKILTPRLIDGVTKIAGHVGDELPGIVAELAPSLVKGGIQLIRSFGGALIDAAPQLKEAGIEIIKAIYEGFTGKEMSGEMFEGLKDRADRAFAAIKNIISGVADFGKQVMDSVGPALLWVGDKALDAFTWIGENIDWLLPVLGSLYGSLMAFKGVSKVTSAVSGFMSIFSKGGGKGGGLLGGAEGGAGGAGGGIFSTLAKTKPTTILKGMANLAIILGGLILLGIVFAAAAPYIASLSDMKSMGELLFVIGAVGLMGTAMAKLAGHVGNIPVSTVAKGLANIAIVMVGFGALAFVLGWASSLFDFDMGSMLKLVAMIGVVGLVGTALAGLAGVIGLIPIPVVLMGLANIALALGGFGLIIAAFGALALIPGFDDFMTRGGETLANLTRIIGEVAGSLIGGIGEGISNSLPAIGENLSAFAESIKPMFDTFATVDTSALSEFATAFGIFMLAIAAEEITSFITGGVDYAALGTQLSEFGTNLGGFFSSLEAIPEASFDKATSLFNCLANVNSLPKDGGIVQWFTGTIDFTGIAAGIQALASPEMISAMTALSNLPETAYTSLGNLFEALGGVEGLPKDGGIAQWFTGTIDYAGLASGIQILASPAMVAALTAIAAIPENSYTSLTALFEALAGVSELPNEGGVFQWFSGTNSITSISNQLPTLASDVSAFFTNLGGITDFSAISRLFEELASVDSIDADAAEGGWFGGDSDLTTLGKGLASFATESKPFFDMIAVTDTSKMTGFFAVLGTAGDLPEKLSGLDETMGTTLGNIVDTVETSMTDIQTSIQTGITNIVSVFTGAQTTLYSSGVSMFQGLNNGMLAMLPTLISTARRAAAAIKQATDIELKIHSPSRVMEESGMYAGLGQVVGLRSTIPEMRTAAQEVSQASVPYLGSYSPYSDDGGSTSYYDEESAVYTISPVFNLTISGSQDDRALARKVKQYVAEAVEETFDSFDRQLAY